MSLSDGIKQNRIIKNMKAKNTMYYTDEYAPDLFNVLISFVFIHFVFMVEFFWASIIEMVFYNIVSILFFLILAVLLFTKEKINYSVVDILVSGEIILHQVLAVHFVGIDAGFQYIILGLAVPTIHYSLKNTFTIITIAKAMLGLIVFGVCDYLYKYRLMPVYRITDAKWLAVSYYFCMLCLFVMLAKGTIETYTKYKVKLKREYQFHKEAIEKQLEMQQNVIQTIADIVEARDETTGQHTERTKDYVLQILLKLKECDKYKDCLTDDYIKEVASAAVLHDIGKIKIPDAILKKPARLSNEEYEVIKSHTVEGSNLLDVCYKSIDNESYYEIAKNIALYHHERWDGNGYPQKLSREDIPLEARIMAVADVYDALMSKRPYKEPLDKATALEIMKEGRGTQFDPDIFDCFIDYIEKKNN